ncbi:substrate-binding domain-containing protein [Burkholderiaceae bacterium FT117]|uniref:molybdate ABC transporter substrate-binding protein n=1 Tax=Zeimonas sediminis TaxID=2944268 RepID=UPI002342DC25|nr:substrate-binding domain-containing protein [Zeimonas sediminis]MCM5571581.1 substrate-binding domain-containing protein [Zeimonas sediminis]
MTTKTLNILCAGAAQGLVKALQPKLAAQADATIAGRFGAVGAMKEALLAGEPCDLMVVTDKMIGELAAAGALIGDTRRPLGRVRTGIAVRSGEPRPDVSTPEALRAALLSADAIYFPDPERATAGIHFANVMRELGIHEQLAPRFRAFPNGATAMRELAAQAAPRLIGCTQITEINYTEGVDLVGALPQRFELATVYSAAVSATAKDPALAALFLDMLAGDASRELRAAGGFEFDA